MKEGVVRRIAMVRLAVVVTVATMAFGIGGASACGCGALLRAQEVSERALVTFHGGTETIIPGLTIKRVGDHAAVVFPVPERPTIHALKAKLHIFSQLENATSLPAAPGPAGGGGPSAGAPTVVSEKVIGAYKVTVLRGGSRQTVLRWLSSHHYALPSGAGPILGSYIARGWYFVALRLSDRFAGQVKPLAISFSASRLVYPMKLSRVATEPVDLELFLNTDGPVSVHGAARLRTIFHGDVASTPVPLSEGVRALLPAPYLSRVEISGVDPGRIRSDIVAVPKG